MKQRFSIKSFICIFSLMLILGLLNVRGNEVTLYDAKYSEDSLDEYLLECKSCEITNDGEYHIKSDDPQLIFDFAKKGKEVYAIKIILSENINLENVNAFFGMEKLEFSENDSLYFHAEESNVIEISSNRPFKYLRIDINEDTKIQQSKIAYDIDAKKSADMRKYVYVIITAFLVSIVCAFIKPVCILITNILAIIKKYIYKIWNNRKKFCVLLLASIVELILSFLFEKLFVHFNDKVYLNKFHMLLFFASMFLITFTIIFWKKIKRYAHLYYFVILMMVGTLHVIASPPSAGVAWDDQIHYGRTAYISWNASGRYTYSDYNVSRLYSAYLFGGEIYQREGREQWITLINSEKNDILLNADYDVSFGYISYIPAAVGLNIGRGMGLSFTHTFMLGKWMNLLCYTSFLSISIWLLNKRGKILVALLGAIPTILFNATTYSYDWWVISLVILSLSIIYSKIQNDKKISTRCVVLSMGIFLLALLPKAIYFALAFPLLFLEHEKFENSKLAKIIIISTMILLALTFVAPILMGSNANTDIRGGEGVDSLGQIKYILTNPVEYSMNLLEFLKGYLSLDSSREYLTFFAYYGHAEYFTVCIALLFAGMIIDNNEWKKESRSKLQKILVLLTVFGTMILVATSLYISFTPVGSSSVNGCQPRYILPVLFMLIYNLSELKINVSEKTKTNFFAIGTLIMLFIFMNGINELCISLY